MKLIIFTPAIKASAIGRMTSLVTRALVAEGHDVTVVRAESATLFDRETHDFHASLIAWNEHTTITDLADQADAIVYQIGNSFEMHQGCLEWISRLPGVVCLHDFYLGHLFHEWAQTNRKQANAIIRAWYGEEIESWFFDHSDGEDFLERSSDAASMAEWICSQALAVITHSSWAIDRVLRSCPGPVHVVSLAYDGPEQFPSTDAMNNDAFRILTIGHVNPNKRISSVIQAIGNSDVLRRRTIYNIVGQIQPGTKAELATLAEQCGVRIAISGEVDDSTLAHAIEQADVICCLRWPSLEAASASAIEAMLYGKPIVVTNTGFYSEIPDSCAIKIDPENEIPSLQSAIENLFSDPAQREKLGHDARNWAHETFSPQKYADKLLEVALLARRTSPIISLADDISDLLHDWGASDDLIQLECTMAPLQSLCEGLGRLRLDRI